MADEGNMASEKISLVPEVTQVSSSDTQLDNPTLLVPPRSGQTENQQKDQQQMNDYLGRIAFLHEVEYDLNLSPISEEVVSFNLPDPSDQFVRYIDPKIGPIKNGDEIPEVQRSKIIEGEKNEARVKMRSGIKTISEEATQRAFSTLLTDVTKLLQDRGLNEKEIASITGELTTSSGKKRRPFGESGKEEQFGILKRMLNVRGEILKNNFELYIYYLRRVSDHFGLDTEYFENLNVEFNTASDSEKIAISARLRRDLYIKVGDYFINIDDKLRIIERAEGEHPGLIRGEHEKKALSFQAATLPEKFSILDRVHKRRLIFSISYLEKIIELRRELEKLYLGKTSSTQADTSNYTKEDRLNGLQLELARIFDLIKQQTASLKLFPGQVDEDSEISIIETLEYVNGDDKSYLETYKRVGLLRN